MPEKIPLNIRRQVRKQEFKEAMHNIHLAIIRTGKTDEIKKKNEEIQKRTDIDERTKGELNKLALGAENWKRLQAALETAKSKLPRPKVSKNESSVYTIEPNYKDYVDKIFRSNDSPEHKDIFFHEIQNQTNMSRIQQPLRNFSPWEIFSSKTKAMLEATKRYTSTQRVISRLARHAKNMKRDCKNDFAKEVKKLNLQARSNTQQ